MLIELKAPLGKFRPVAILPNNNEVVNLGDELSLCEARKKMKPETNSWLSGPVHMIFDDKGQLCQ